jgi:hypothetical protein
MAVTPTRDVEFFMNIGQSILESAIAGLECYDLEVPSRAFVGFDEPPQDCCPELVVWLGNVRVWDGDFPETRTSTSLLHHWGYAFDCTVRIGRCYVDVDEKGNPIDSGVLADWTQALYADASALYFGWLGQWQAELVSELSRCDLGDVGPLTQYNEGGCAGHQFTVTIGVF